MTLSHEEFVRRFALHILPKRFVRIQALRFPELNMEAIQLTDLQSKLTGISLTSLPVVLKGTNHKCSHVAQTGRR